MKTGSRSGLFTLAMLVFVTFLLATPTRKMVIAGGCLALVLASSLLLPDYLKARYQTIFSPADANSLAAKDAKHLSSDIASSEERKALLMQSIQMTFENPIFGVGPGVFSYASWDQRKDATGVGGLAQVTHNTYTQISSETGIPGFLLFAATMVFVLKSAFQAFRGLKETDPLMAKSGSYLFCMLAAFSVGIFFLSVGYTHIISTLFALTVALENVRSKLAHETRDAATVNINAANPSAFGSGKPNLTGPLAAAVPTNQIHGPLANSKALRAAGLTKAPSRVAPPVSK
jgi:O-antigen ligase